MPKRRWNILFLFRGVNVANPYDPGAYGRGLLGGAERTIPPPTCGLLPISCFKVNTVVKRWEGPHVVQHTSLKKEPGSQFGTLARATLDISRVLFLRRGRGGGGVFTTLAVASINISHFMRSVKLSLKLPSNIWLLSKVFLLREKYAIYL